MATRDEIRESARRKLAAGDPMTTGEAAALLGVHPKTVCKWIRAGRLDASRPGTHYRIAAPEVARRILGRRAG